MSMKISDYTGNSKPRMNIPDLEPGTYPARIVQLINLGRQVKTNWKTGEVETYDDGNPVVQHKVWITSELPTETFEYDGEEAPRWMSKEVTISGHEKAALPKIMDACGVTSGDITDMLGKPHLVTIGQTSTGKPKITSYSKPMKGMNVPDIMNKDKMMVFDPYMPDMDDWDKLPKFLKEKIEGAEDYQKMRFPAADKKAPVEEVVEDDVPF